jgi:two-component system, OmpR family, manganese sensing response regulator
MPLVLIIEDDERLCRMIYKALSLNGFDVTVCHDGDEGMELALRSFFDIVITDINLPTRSGLEICAALREKRQNLKTGIIVLTSTDLIHQELDIYRNGADAWLRKPYHRERLLETIERVLQEKEMLTRQVVLGNWIDFNVKSSLEILQSINIFVNNLMISTTLKEDEIRKLGFAINEMLLNAMEHGNQFNIHKEVRCSYVVFADKLIIKIEDQGDGFKIEEVPDPMQDPIGVAMRRQQIGKRPGGYGLALSKKYADLIYNEMGNVVILTKHFEPFDDEADTDTSSDTTPKDSTST